MPRLTRLRAIPWLLLFEAARVTHKHLGEHLTATDRRRVTEIVRRSKGDPRRVSPRDRDELRAIAGRLDLTTLGRDLVPTMLRGSGRGGRKR